MTTQRPSSKPARSTRFGLAILWRPKVWAGFLIVLLVGLAGHARWRQYAPTIAANPQFQITAERIHVTPPPPWIHSDVKAEALRDAGLESGFSLLDDPDRLHRRVRDAFGLHPWVADVKRIQADLPASLDVELQYRRPVAAVEVTTDEGPAYLPIDAAGVRLPDADFSVIQRRLLPRISGVAGRPVVGQPWRDPRVADGVQVVTGLADVWSRLRLVAVVPSPHPKVRADVRYYTFEIVTSGGTRIVWGAAPGSEQDADESPFHAKRQRLLDYAADHGPLDSIDSPAMVDVRSDLVVTPRTARRSLLREDDATPVAK